MARSRGRIRMHKPCQGSAPPRTHTMGFFDVDSYPRCSQRTTHSICGVRWMGWNDRRCWFDLGHHPMGIANRRNGFVSRVRFCRNWLACGDHCRRMVARSQRDSSIPLGRRSKTAAHFSMPCIGSTTPPESFSATPSRIASRVSNHQCRSILVEVAMRRTSRQGPWRGRIRGVQRQHRLRRRHGLVVTGGAVSRVLRSLDAGQTWQARHCLLCKGIHDRGICPLLRRCVHRVGHWWQLGGPKTTRATCA